MVPILFFHYYIEAPYKIVLLYVMIYPQSISYLIGEIPSPLLKLNKRNVNLLFYIIFLLFRTLLEIVLN